MNYRHIYHAGNFADVLKHAVLARVVAYLGQKEAPFRYIDTHAGTGLYDLSSTEAQKTGEWRDGIGRLLDATLPAAAAKVLSPYLDIVRGENGGTNEITRYPGSPLVARRLMRPGDALVINEAHPDDCERLRETFHKDRLTKVLEIDGWQALKSLLPPKERRGVILVDPPFEVAGEFDRMLEGLADVTKRFATGTLIFWYAIKDERAVERFKRKAAETNIPKLLSVELFVAAPSPDTGLTGTGLLILNPPFTLYDELAELMPHLTKRLARGPGAAFSLRWLTSKD